MGKVWGKVGVESGGMTGVSGGYDRVKGGYDGGSGGSGDGSTERNGNFTGELPGVVGYPHREGMGSLRFHPGHEGRGGSGGTGERDDPGVGWVGRDDPGGCRWVGGDRREGRPRGRVG